MKKILSMSIILFLLSLNDAYALDLSPIVQSVDLKKITLSRNDLKNQYTIAMDKFMQNNVRSSYQDFKVLIDNVKPNDFVYLQLSKQMASIGFFNLAELALSKITDEDISNLMEEDVKKYYYPKYSLEYKDQIYLAEIYSGIMYNDQSREATGELKKQIKLLTESDYANYLVAFGSMKIGDIDQAKQSIDVALEKNPQNINYKRLRSEIISQTKKTQDSLKLLKELENENINTVIFDKEITASKHYILYKISKNDYLKKYYLAYYYYDENEHNKALRVLQTSVSGKKNINKDVFALTARVYFDSKEFEKAQDYALKAIDIDKNNVMALNVLGDVYFRNKDYKTAQNYYKKASPKDTTFTSSIKLAQTYKQLHEEKKAKEIYSKILKLSSKSYQAYYEMALLEKDRELAYLKKSVAINPKFTQAWIDLARYEIERNEDYNKAMSYLGIVKFLGDENYRYYYYLGLVMKSKGLTDEANKFFQKSLKLNPEGHLVDEELSI